MDTRDNTIKFYDEVPEHEHKFLLEIPIGQIVTVNGYNYEISRVDIKAQEVILKPKGKDVEQEFREKLAKLKGKGGLGN